LGAKSILPAKILRERRQRILFGWLEDGCFEKNQPACFDASRRRGHFRGKEPQNHALAD
jgi:hypothetical protein